MAKEMIISVNGREKKIAILDNGQVTEFYIERGGEENSGVVGNIYKGRVQRVLPGMQSAFVEIGLERDAFLYVSDFFDEEEEIERIMLDKGKKVPAEAVEKEVTDHLQRARLEREKQMETVQELVEPLAEIKIADEDEQPETAPEARDERRGKKRGRDRSPQNKETSVDSAITEETELPQAISDEDFQESDADQNEFQEGIFDQPVMADELPLFDEEESGFERIIDDEAEETPGEMFKDAYVQERIVNKVRAVEFDMESTPIAEVGSLFEDSSIQGTGFERIADEDDNAPSLIEPVEEKPAKTRRTRASKKSKKELAEEISQMSDIETGENMFDSSEMNPDSQVSDEPEIVETHPETIQETDKKSTEKKKVEPKPSRKKQRGGKKQTKTQTITEGEASVIESPDTAEMAVRRGGRRRRGGNRPQQQNRPGEERAEGAGENDAETSPIEASGEDSKPNYQNGNGRRGNNGGRDNRERNQPTISDLLREGQEIIVQIAKEPIARKGARITSHIALPGRYLVYMPTIEHVGVSRKVENSSERGRLRTAIQRIRNEEDVPSGGFIVRTAGIGVTEDNLRDDARYLVRTWRDIKKQADKSKSPALVHQDLDLIQRILRDQLSDEFAAIRIDSEDEYLRIVEFVNRIQPKMVNRVKLYTREQPILESYGVQEEVDKALKPRVWLKSGGYLVINQTEALVAIDVNTGKFVGKGNARLEDTITKTNMEAVEEIARQIRLRDLGGIIVLDLIDMEDRRNRHKVLATLQDALSTDKSPTKVLSFNDFGLIIMTRKRVKQSLERTMCSPCAYCQGSGLVKSAQTVCYEILEEARHLNKGMHDARHTTLRVNAEVAKALRGEEKEVLREIEDYLGAIDLTGDPSIHQEQFDFAFI